MLALAMAVDLMARDDPVALMSLFGYPTPYPGQTGQAHSWNT